jgi:hypothetical protein
VLKNPRLFALFEALGGRMTGAWLRRPGDGRIVQVAGNFLAYNDRDTEEEGDANDDGAGGTGARRTSSFKDWWAAGPGTGYVNQLYAVAAAGADGWTFTSPDGKVAKTVSLAAAGSALRAEYSLAGIDTLFVRCGLAPDLAELLAAGQRHLHSPPPDGQRKRVAHFGPAGTVVAGLRYAGPGLGGAVVNAAAGDRNPGAPVPFAPDTVNMRNQALLEQVELAGSGSFSFELEFAGAGDFDADGLPDDWEIANSLDPADDGSGDPANGAAGDPDGDGLDNATEWLVGLDPRAADAAGFPRLAAVPQADGSVRLVFPTLPDRRYRVWFSDDLAAWQPLLPDTDTSGQPANPAFERSAPAPAARQVRRFFQLEISPAGP